MALLLFFSELISSPTLPGDGLAPPPMDAENSVLPPPRKHKVVFVLGATGTGKSKLAIALATRFDGEVVNSDKMQVYSGLDVITNKVTEEESAHVPHHLLGGVHPDADFTASDFRREAMLAVASIVARGRLPVVAGGSNSYVEALVDGEAGEFRRRYDCCFLWVDVDPPVLHEFVGARVDKMVRQGLVDEARSVFDPSNGDYSRGVRRSIGVPELDRYFRAEAEAAADRETLEGLRAMAIDEIKANTCKLTVCQLLKIHRFCRLEGWDVRRIDATEFFLKRGDAASTEEVWERIVGAPSSNIVRAFLERDNDHRGDNNNVDINIANNNDDDDNNNNNCTAHGEREPDQKDESNMNVITNGADDHENGYHVGDDHETVEVMVEKAVLAAAAAAAVAVAAAAAAADDDDQLLSDDAETAVAAATAAAATAAGATV